MSTTTPGADQLQALISYSNNKTGASDTTLSDAVARLVDGYGGGCEDGIVVKARNANGYPINVEYFGNLFPYAIGAARNDVDYYMSKIENITFHPEPTEIPECAFFCCARRGNGISALTFPNVTSIGNNAFGGGGGASGAKIGVLRFPSIETINTYNCFSSNAVSEIYLPKLIATNNTNASYGIFRYGTNLTYVEIGSVGYAAPVNIKHHFRDCPQTTLTICFYTLGERVDSILTILRTTNMATGATIIFKASEATTYNGTSYAAGDTILTSTPNS